MFIRILNVYKIPSYAILETLLFPLCSPEALWTYLWTYLFADSLVSLTVLWSVQGRGYVQFFHVLPAPLDTETIDDCSEQMNTFFAVMTNIDKK